MFAAKDTFPSGTSAIVESNIDAGSYQIVDDVDAGSGVKASYVVSSRNADGEVPQQQCVIESNDGESTGETFIGEATAVQVDLDITGGDMTLGISAVEVT